MKFRLVATDLDGTFLAPDATVTPRAAAVVRAIRATGALVVPVTARGPWSVVRLAGEAGMDGPAVLVSGAVLFDLPAREVVEEHRLDPILVREAVDTLRAKMPGVLFGFARAGVFDMEPGFPFGLPQPPRSRVADALDLIDAPVWKIAVKHPSLGADELVEVVRGLVPDAHVVDCGGNQADLSAPAARKAAMLARVCERTGVALEEVVAFGDLPIDIEMMTSVGRGIAPANAHPSVRAAADELTASNEDDGVAVALERLLDEDAFAPA